MRRIALLTTVLALAACADTEDAIAPVSLGAYAGLSCEQAAYDYEVAQRNLATLRTARTAGAAGNTISVLVLGVPISGADREGQVAAERGRIRALEARLQSC